ncbi:hypothetical protein ABL78_0870 [Leptomonas seymouri]|uniref:Uncharacterized protein n=1 Tax=Leptomonas seymouri TaxID=5684 RepID=A0A0N1I1G6_LEPSE|nr:hypothetical protein ABL78_0870 [Leptomonas seymouri]|eukprot:KPI90010.1 hypothetical protein ABL78_0870 [Leptomonas seymouri]
MMAAPDLVMIDIGAPLHECVRRLQGQLARVELLAAQEASGCSGGSPAHFVASLLKSYRETPNAAFGAGGNELTEAERVAALRRRIAQKLRRLSEEQHMSLCVARSSLEDDDVDAVVSSSECTTAAPQADATTEHKRPSAAQQQQPEHAEEEDDVFGWVTGAAAATALPAPIPLAAPAAQAEAKAASPDVDAILKRIALRLADAVETRYRHAEHLDDVHHQLLQMQRSMSAVLGVEKAKAHGRGVSAKQGSMSITAASEAVGDSGNHLREVLTYRPKHTIASEKEKAVWQRAWEGVLPAAPSNAPPLQVGDAIELVDMAVLAHANAQRYAALQQRWCAVQRDYEGHVERLNRRLAQAALQLEEMERRA